MEEVYQEKLYSKVQHVLQRHTNDKRPVVLMTCGLAGTGKSTLARGVEARLPHFARLSIDEILVEKHGIYGIDYAADATLYEKYQEEGDGIYVARLRGLLQSQRDVILEKSFYARKDRDDYRRMIADWGSGCRVVLVFLKPMDKDALWERIVRRGKKKKGAENALDIFRALFDAYWEGFEDPEGEGEVVIELE